MVCSTPISNTNATKQCNFEQCIRARSVPQCRVMCFSLTRHGAVPHIPQPCALRRPRHHAHAHAHPEVRCHFGDQHGSDDFSERYNRPTQVGSRWSCGCLVQGIPRLDRRRRGQTIPLPPCVCAINTPVHKHMHVTLGWCGHMHTALG